MLQELKVSQFAIIDHLHVEFQQGLNVLSGETGSGKSVLLKSLSLLMGEKASSDVIRSGSQQATVEGSFDLSQREDIQTVLDSIGVEYPDNTLIVKRIIASNDKSKIYLNGSLCTLNQLREVVSPMIEVTGDSAPLIEMTGQHDNRNLTSKAYHLDLLDQYATHTDRRQAFETKYTELKNVRLEISEFAKQAQAKSQRLDFLKFQQSELNKINIDPETDQHIEEDIKKLKSAHKIQLFLDDCENILFSDDDSVNVRLKTVLKKSTDLNSIEAVATQMNSLQAAQQSIEDIFFNLRKDLQKFELDSELLEEKESRLSQIRKLQKKYGPDLYELAQAQQSIEKEISELENSDEHLALLNKKASQIELELKKLGEELHQKRQKYAVQLTTAVNKELADLNMKGVTFDIEVKKLNDFNHTGLSDVEFLCQTSAKDPKRPIAKVASGGELSRILLSLKKALGDSDRPRTYLFDEVDTGVSGLTAEKVGRKLKAIAQGQQVVCVTHLPQVAAFGDIHFVIQKNTAKDSVKMSVQPVSKKERVEEIARLISGEKISKTSMAHAEQLLSEAQI